MAPSRKTKKTKDSSRSVMGQLMPPVDVRSEDMLGELSKRITTGPLTLVLVYADWCGHCTTFKPMMEKLESCPGRTVQNVRLREDMLPKSSLSSTKIEGYPTLLLVDKNGNALKFKTDSGEETNAIPDHTNMAKMRSLVRNAGTPQGLSLLENIRTPNTRSNNIANTNANNNRNNIANNNANNNRNTNANNNNNDDSIISMAPLGTGNVSDVTPNQPLFNTPKNILADRLSSKTVSGQNSALINSGSFSLREATAPVATKQGGGGGLWSSLVMASQNIAPAAALFLGAAYANKGKRATTYRKRKMRRVTRKRA